MVTSCLESLWISSKQEEGGSFVFGVDCTAVLETEGAESSLLECKRRINSSRSLSA